MFAPWNVRVTGRHTNRWGDQRNFLPPDYYQVEVRIGRTWFDGGTAKTWWSAFWMGVAA